MPETDAQGAADPASRGAEGLSLAKSVRLLLDTRGERQASTARDPFARF